MEGSAATVGRVIAPLLGRPGARGGWRGSGVAFQLTNFIRDVRESTGTSTASTCPACPRTTCAPAPRSDSLRERIAQRGRAARASCSRRPRRVALAPGDAPRRAHGPAPSTRGCSTASRPTATTCSSARARLRPWEAARAGRCAAMTARRAARDVLVCGASFAGLAVARELAGAGADVLVVDRYEIGERATSACAAPTPWLHAMGVAGAIRQRAARDDLHHAARDGPLPAAVELVGLRLPRRCASCCGRSAATRASSARRSSGRDGRRRSHSDRGPLSAPLVVDAMGWRRVLTEPHHQPPDAPLSRGSRGPPARPGRRRRPRHLGRALARAPRLRLARAGRRRGAHRRGLLRSRISTCAEPTDALAARLDADGRALPGQLVPAPAAHGHRRTACSSSATAPGTASRSRARASAPRSTSASRPGASCAPCSPATSRASARSPTTPRSATRTRPPSRRALRLQRLIPALPPRVLDARPARHRPQSLAAARRLAGAFGWYLDAGALRVLRGRHLNQRLAWRSPTTSAASCPVVDPGLADGRGADARLRERGGARAHARDRRAAPVEPLARRAVAQGRDVRQHPGASARCASTATATRCSRSSSPPGPACHTASARAFTTASSSRPRRTRRCRRSSARSPRAPPSAPRAPTPSSCSTTRALIGEKVQEEAEEVARAAREETDERVDEEAADVLYHLTVLLHARGRALADAEEVLIGRRRWTARHARRAARSSRRSTRSASWRASTTSSRCATRFIDDCETPVSAFLKLRGRARPGVPARVGRAGPARRALSFIGVAPAQVAALVLGDGGDPYALAAAEVARLRQAPLADAAAVRRRRGRLLRLRPRAHRRAARRAQPGRRSACRTWR